MGESERVIGDGTRDAGGVNSRGLGIGTRAEGTSASAPPNAGGVQKYGSPITDSTERPWYLYV